MHLRLFVIAVALLCGNYACYANIDASIVEKERAALIDKIQKNTVSADVRDEILNLIKDDSAALDWSDIKSTFSDPAPSDKVKMLRSGYMVAIGFRYRDDPTKLVEFYKQLPKDIRPAFFGLFVTEFNDFVTPEHWVLGKEVLLDATQSTSSLIDQPKALASNVELCRIAVRFMGTSNSQKAMPAVLLVLKTAVVEPSLRFNIVAEAINVGKADAVELGRWYFQEYCYKPFETKVLVDFFAKYLGDVPLQNLLDNKKADLNASIAELH